jgi:hypothetical protein
VEVPNGDSRSCGAIIISQPTPTIRPGFPVRVIVNRDLVLVPFHVKSLGKKIPLWSAPLGVDGMRFLD